MAFLVCVLRKLIWRIFVYKLLISIHWTSSLWRKMWLLGHPEFFEYCKLFSRPEGMVEHTQILDKFKTSNFLFFQHGAFGSFWPGIVVLWDTLSGCHEITHSGITGRGPIYLLFFAVGPRWPCDAVSWIMVMAGKMSGRHGDGIC